MKKILFSFFIFIIFLFNGCTKFQEKTTEQEIDLQESISDLTKDFNYVTTKLATIPDRYFKNYKSYSDSHAVFSPDGKRVAYRVRDSGKETVIIDDKEGKPYDELNYYFAYLVFSPDSKKLAYIATEGNKYFVVVNDKEGKRYDYVGIPVFSPDSQKVAYHARVGRSHFIVVNEIEGKSYEGIGSRIKSGFDSSIVFSPDSQKVAYVAYNGLGQRLRNFVVTDDKEGMEYQIVYSPIVFSPDSKKVAYLARDEGKEFVVVDGAEVKRYDDVKPPVVFSPDSQKVAYVASQGNKWFVVFGDKEMNSYERFGESIPVINPAISPDGQIVAFIAHKYNVLTRNANKFIVIGEKEGKSYDSIYSIFPIWSPDGQKLAYIARKDETDYLIISDKEGKTHNEISRVTVPYSSTLRFSPDSKSIAYGYLTGNELWWKVIPII